VASRPPALCFESIAPAGFYHSPGWNRDYPKLQIMTIEQLLSGGEVKMPPNAMTFKQAERSDESTGVQKALESVS
jgi:site-specific DNA-methyltransferase (adenine-specific)